MKKFKKIYIEITNICNKNCSFCSIDNRAKEFMSIEKFEHILKEIKPYTNYIYLHVKGEPLLHPNFSSILDLCDQYQIHVNITTNGTLLLKQVETLTSHPCVRQINISLHSFENESNQTYIDQVMEATKKIQSETNIIVVYRFWALKNNQLTKENHALLNEIIHSYQLNQPVIYKIMQDMNIKIGKDLYINKAPLFEWPNVNNNFVSETGFCYGMSRHVAILVDGTVVPCCLDSEGIINLGNIFTTSFTSIMEGDRAQTLLKGFRNHKLTEELCKHCEYRMRFKRNMI